MTIKEKGSEWPRIAKSTCVVYKIKELQTDWNGNEFRNKMNLETVWKKAQETVLML